MSHWHCPPGRKPLTKIPAGDLPSLIGKTIHLASNNSGAQFVLHAVHGDEIVVGIGNGRNRRLMSAQAGEARYPRKLKR